MSFERKTFKFDKKGGGGRVLKNQLYFALKKEMSFEKPMSNET